MRAGFRMARRRKKKGAPQIELPMESIEDASLVAEAQRRYLNYALSVIMSRALPDVRDGLKPVQRRILYTMYNELRLRSDVKHRKSAAIVGDVMGKFHPHGDTAIYDALVRMAQSFTMREPLVDGRGNFGSPDGDSAAAMRYTEARLQKLADELLVELAKKTVAFRPNYDGRLFEPIVLPARFPNLLVNGSQGIAVGMATSIPPHNLSEVIHACVALIDDDLTTKQLMKFVRGPDFPTGGELISSKSELAAAYETGHGSLKLRGEWKTEKPRSGNPFIVIHSIPYSVERSTVVEKIAEVIIAKKLPVLIDVRDESTDDCRIVCEMKKDVDPQFIMAYLYKHTPLQTNVQVNLTCLVPTANPEVAAPQRIGLKAILRHFIDFRMEVVTKRLEFELDQLLKRIHILEGFVTIFDVLDEAIRIIRKSEGKQDAAQKLMKRFNLDDLQVDAILELKLYRLAKLQILEIRTELAQKQKEARRVQKLLKSPAARWKLVRAELQELASTYADPRRTRITAKLDEPEFDADVDEDAMVVVTEQGWVKRQQRVKDVASTRVRKGDRVLAVLAGSTKSTVAFFSSHGVCYVSRIVDIAATTGHGTPLQTMFKMADGERIVGAMGFDPRFMEVPFADEESDEPEPPYAIAVTRGGLALRFSLRGHREPSTRSGRKFTRPKQGDEVVYVAPVFEEDCVACVTKQRRALVCEAEDVSLLAGAGRGVMLIKLQKDDEVLAARVLSYDDDVLIAKREGGSDYRITLRKYEIVSRGGKGFQLFTRGAIEGEVYQEPEIPIFPED
ncbi:MAG: DNA topoisomerase IV subunit A [Deltaproteobacteria bacterium]|nr:DNA topoisomerase IV subunit A [Deltaproteobacteria bacterium]